MDYIAGISTAYLFLSKIDYDAVNKEWEQQQADDSNKEQLSQQNTDNVNIGMSVELPTEPGKKVTVMDVFFSNAQGKFYAHFSCNICGYVCNSRY